jgi:amino acid permease
MVAAALTLLTMVFSLYILLFAFVIISVDLFQHNVISVWALIFTILFPLLCFLVKEKIKKAFEIRL